VAKRHVAAAPPNILMSSSPFTQPTSSELKTPGYQFSHAAVRRLLRCNGRRAQGRFGLVAVMDRSSPQLCPRFPTRTSSHQIAGVLVFSPIGRDAVNVYGRDAELHLGIPSPDSSPPSNALPRLRDVALLSLPRKVLSRRPMSGWSQRQKILLIRGHDALHALTHPCQVTLPAAVSSGTFFAQLPICD
jgi:hypothetical protein